MLLRLLLHRRQLQAIAHRHSHGVLHMRRCCTGTCTHTGTSTSGIAGSCRWLLSCAIAALPCELRAVLPAVLWRILVARVAPLRMLLLAAVALVSRLLLHPALRELSRQAARDCGAKEACTQASTCARAKPTGSL